MLILSANQRLFLGFLMIKPILEKTMIFQAMCIKNPPPKCAYFEQTARLVAIFFDFFKFRVQNIFSEEQKVMLS